MEVKGSVGKVPSDSEDVHREYIKSFIKIFCDKLQEENISFQRNKSVTHDGKTVESDVWINGIVFINVKGEAGEHTPEDKTLISTYKVALELPGILVCFEEDGRHQILEI